MARIWFESRIESTPCAAAAVHHKRRIERHRRVISLRCRLDYSYMNVLLFGATGMLGQAVLRECLLDTGVQSVCTIGRSATGVQHVKLREIVHPDLFRYENIEDQLRGFDACFFCLGVTSAGKSEAEYTRLTYTLTLAAAGTLAHLNPGMTFIYISGTGTDSSEKGSLMWARIKGRTENAILRLPFRAAYMFRPAVVLPVNGERSRTGAYRIAYTIFRPLLPLLRRLPSRYMVTSEQFGRAMIRVVREGFRKSWLESSDIHDVGR